MAPDLVVEVVSTHDEAEDVEEKVRDYLRAGECRVWVAYPRTRIIHVRRPDGRDTTLEAGDTLEGEDVLPGFTCPVAALLPA